MCIGRVTYMSS